MRYHTTSSYASYDYFFANIANKEVSDFVERILYSISYIKKT